MLIDVHRPRNFDASDLQTEVPGDVAFYFCYNMYEANASETGKILIKDIKATNSSAGLSQICKNLAYLFALLKAQLEMNKEMAGVQTLSSQVFTGMVKKGMPGFAEFGTPVDVQISTLMNPLHEIISMHYDS